MKDLLPRVIKAIQKDFPACADYNVIGETVELFNKEDKLIGTIKEQQLTRYWNLVESGIF